MFDLTILEIGLGLVLVYFLMSLFCTALNQWIMRVFSLRAKTLKAGILQMLEGVKNPTKCEEKNEKDNVNNNEAKKDKKLIDKTYDHPLINGLHRKSLWHKLVAWLGIKNLGPPNISDRNFALALIDNLLNADPLKKMSHYHPRQHPTKFRVPEWLDANIKDMLEKIGKGIDNIDSPADIKKMLRTLLNSAIVKENEVITTSRTSIEEWFNDTID